MSMIRAYRGTTVTPHGKQYSINFSANKRIYSIEHGTYRRCTKHSAQGVIAIEVHNGDKYILRLVEPGVWHLVETATKQITIIKA